MIGKTIKILTICYCFLTFLSSCVSFDGSHSPPEITNRMPLEKKLSNAIDFGGKTFSEVVKEVNRQNLWKKAEKPLSSLIIANADTWQSWQMINAANLYKKTNARNVDVIFFKLVEVDRPLVTKLAWEILKVAEPKRVGSLIDSFLSSLILEGKIDKHLIPEMADAVRVLDIKSVYDVMKLGLFKTGNPSFVLAMTKLNPEKSPDDLFDYLVLPENGELRQRALKSIDTITALQILVYLGENPISFAHRKLGKIFVYAASRNVGLREAARKVIDTLVPINVEVLAYELSQQPAWAQLSIIESARRNLTSNTKNLLYHLRKITVDQNIAEEVGLLRF